MPRKQIMAALVVWIVASVAAFCFYASHSDSVVLESSEIVVPTVSAGEVIRVPVRITNRGLMRVGIDNIFASCGCTQLEGESGGPLCLPFSIKPGGVATIYAEVDTKHQRRKAVVQVGFVVAGSGPTLTATIICDVIPGPQLATSLVDVDLACSKKAVVLLGCHSSMHCPVERVDTHSRHLTPHLSHAGSIETSSGGPYDGWVPTSRIEIAIDDVDDVTGSYVCDVHLKGRLDPLSFILRVWDSRRLNVQPQVLAVSELPQSYLIRVAGMAPECDLHLVGDISDRMQLISQDQAETTYRIEIAEFPADNRLQLYEVNREGESTGRVVSVQLQRD